MMNIEDLRDFAIRVGRLTEDHLYAFTLDELERLARRCQSEVYERYRPLAVGPSEHAAIDQIASLPLADSLFDRPMAIPLSSPDVVEAMGMDEAGFMTMRRARALEHAVWRVNRLRDPDPVERGAKRED